MSGVVLDQDRWLRHFGQGHHQRLRLLCFHHAGGSASTFRDWGARLPPTVEPIAVQLPGRENRLSEAPYDRMAPLVTRLAEVVAPLVGKPYACFGYSMGARVALCLAHALRERGLPPPRGVYVASSSAPVLRRPVRGWNEPDAGLVSYIRDLGGTPREILDDADLLALSLPTLRADLTVIGTCPYPHAGPLPIPIRAYAGASDDEASPARMLGWQEETHAGFELEVVPGGHFFTPEGVDRMIRSIGMELT